MNKYITELNSKNILFDYDAPTYHLKLFVSKDFKGKIYKLNDNNNVAGVDQTVILAETGVTDMTIDNLSFRTYFSANSKTYTATSVEFDFELSEPLGVTFLDRVAYASKIVGVDNFTKIPFFLEISYRARDRESGEPVTSIEGTTRVFPIQIVSVDISVDSGGSKYFCKAVRANDYAMHNLVGTIRKPSEVYGTSLEELITMLFTDCNADTSVPQHESGMTTPLEKYTIKVEGFKENDLKFYSQSAATELEDSSICFYNLDEDQCRLVVNADSKISRILEEGMQRTVWFQKQVNEAEETDKNVATTTKRKKKLFKIDTEVKIIKYNEQAGEFEREITYRIKPIAQGLNFGTTPKENVTTPVDISNLPQPYPTPSSTKTSGTESSDGAAAVTDGLLVKKYSWLYTGDNIHVIDFDFKINLAWYTALAKGGGHNTNYASSSSGLLHVSKDNEGSTASPARDEKTNEERQKALNPSGSGPPTASLNAPKYLHHGNIEYGLDYSKCITCREDASSAHATTFVGNPKGGGTHKTATLFSNTVMRTRAEFININLKIVGDPYWYLEAPLDREGKGALFFALTTGVPEEPDETGYMAMNRSNMITGIFQVLYLDNNFEKGKFTQTLNAVRDMMSNIKGGSNGAAG